MLPPLIEQERQAQALPADSMASWEIFCVEDAWIATIARSIAEMDLARFFFESARQPSTKVQQKSIRSLFRRKFTSLMLNVSYLVTTFLSLSAVTPAVTPAIVPSLNY